jgi:hypothetical protein
VSGGLFFVRFCFWVVKDFAGAAKRFNKNELQLSALAKETRNSVQNKKQEPFYLSDNAPAGINPKTGLHMSNDYVDVAGNHFGLSAG